MQARTKCVSISREKKEKHKKSYFPKSVVHFNSPMTRVLERVVAPFSFVHRSVSNNSLVQCRNKWSELVAAIDHGPCI